MIRKHNDSVKDGVGDSGTEGQDYTKKYVTDPWSYPGNREVPETQDPKGRKVRNDPGHAAYSPDSDGAMPRSGEDFQFSAGVRDLMADVETNQDQNVSSDPHNAITAGVNRSQSEGSKDPRRGK
jgi:hypothetical protein